MVAPPPVPPAAVMLGEWGWLDKSTRNKVYKAWTDALFKSGGQSGADGGLYWILSARQDDGTLGLRSIDPTSGAANTFGRVAGRLGDSNRVSLEIPRASAEGSTVMVMGELAGDVLTIRDCHSGAEAGPFASGTAFERVTIR